MELTPSLVQHTDKIQLAVDLLAALATRTLSLVLITAHQQLFKALRILLTSQVSFLKILKLFMVFCYS